MVPPYPRLMLFFALSPLSPTLLLFVPHSVHAVFRVPVPFPVHVSMSPMSPCSITHRQPAGWLPGRPSLANQSLLPPEGRMIARRVSHHMGSQSPLVSFPPGYCPRTKVSSRYAPMARLLGLNFSCIIHILTIPLRILILRASPLLLVFLSP